MKLLDDFAWFCMEKLKKHSFQTKQIKIWPTIPNKSQKNTEEIPLLEPFKGPCTLP